MNEKKGRFFVLFGMQNDSCFVYQLRIQDIVIAFDEVDLEGRKSFPPRNKLVPLQVMDTVKQVTEQIKLLYGKC